MTLAAFVVDAIPPAAARATAARALLDTIGVTLAGAAEPAARIVQRVVAQDGAGTVPRARHVDRAPPPATPRSPTAPRRTRSTSTTCASSRSRTRARRWSRRRWPPAEVAGASGRALLDAYVVGFEIEGRLGRAMNPRHYQRGWHCTSTLGTIGAAAAAARLFGLDAEATRSRARDRRLGSVRTEGKLRHDGQAPARRLAARNGVVAAQLAQAGMTASARGDRRPARISCRDGRRAPSLEPFVADLGTRWEIVDTGITVKLYPSCAGTHPTLDALLDLNAAAGFSAADVEAIDVGVDPIVPTILLYDRPSSGLEGKFSMPFCAAVAVARGRVGIDTFDRGGARRSHGRRAARSGDDAG